MTEPETLFLQVEQLQKLWQDMKAQPTAFDQQDLSRVQQTLCEVQHQYETLQQTWSEETRRNYLLTQQIERVLQQRDHVLQEAMVLADFPSLLDYFVNKQVQLTTLKPK